MRKKGGRSRVPKNGKVILDSVSCPATLSSNARSTFGLFTRNTISGNNENEKDHDFGKTMIPDAISDIAEEREEDFDSSFDGFSAVPPSPAIKTVIEENTYDMKEKDTKKSVEKQKKSDEKQKRSSSPLPPRPPKKTTTTRSRHNNYNTEQESEQESKPPPIDEVIEIRRNQHTRSNNNNYAGRKNRRQRNFSSSRYHAQSSLVSSLGNWDDSSSFLSMAVTTATVIATKPSWGHYAVGLFVFLGWSLHHAYHDNIHTYFRAVQHQQSDAGSHRPEHRIYDQQQQYLRGGDNMMTTTENGNIGFHNNAAGGTVVNVNPLEGINSGELMNSYGLSDSNNNNNNNLGGTNLFETLQN